MDNVVCINKQQIKDAVANLIFDCYFSNGQKIFCHTTGIPAGSDQATFLFHQPVLIVLWK